MRKVGVFVLQCVGSVLGVGILIAVGIAEHLESKKVHNGKKT